MLRALRPAGRGAIFARSLWVLLCICAASAREPLPAADAPLAVVTDVDGKAGRLRAGHSRALVALDVLERSDQLLLPARARVEIAFFSGMPRVFVLTGPGRFALRGDAVIGLGGSGAVLVRDLDLAWRTLQIRPALLGRASVALRGAPGAGLEVQAPVGAQLDVALDALRWRPPYGRSGQNWEYAVRLIDAQGAVVFSASTRDTAIALPAHTPWVREQPYLWTVDAVGDDGRRVGAAAEFLVLDRATQERLDVLAQITERARTQQTDAQGTVEEVLLAIALEQAGLRSEADRRWRAVASTRPAFARFATARP